MRCSLIALVWMHIVALTYGQQAEVLQIGDPLATTVQLPTFGVSIDAQGVLEVKAFADPGGRLLAQRAAAARVAAAGNAARPAVNRKVSLVRLQSAITRLHHKGQSPTETMRKLAGLTRVTAAFCYPDTGEIVIAGPAEPWVEDLSGRSVGTESGRPTLLLDDLVVAIRAYPSQTEHRGFVGCTINPRREGLAKLVRFQRTIPRSVPQSQRAAVIDRVARGVKESLGSAEIKVFGVSPQTHFARVMIEADYRMKRIAVGVEPPPVRLTTYASAITTAGTGMLERWWFTPEYDGVVTSPDHLAMRMSGQGIRLQSENKLIRSDGSIVDVAAGPRPSRRKSTRATQVFANSFTKRYEDVAKASPVYAQLRQLTDWLILAAYLREFRWYQRGGWNVDHFLDEAAYPVNTLDQPVSAEVVVNAFWKQNRMFAPAGGGVSIEAELALRNLTQAGKELDKTKQSSRPPDDQQWWWD